VADTAACVARLPAAVAAEGAAGAVSGGVPAAGAASLRARPRDVPRLAAAVALRPRACASASGPARCARREATGAGVVGAVAGDVSLLAALVARLGLGLHGAVPRDVAFESTVIASRGPSLGALRRLVADYMCLPSVY